MWMAIDMSTGKREDAFGTFEDEVMKAEWQPMLPALQLGLQEMVPRSRNAARAVDAEAYMRQIYLAQE